jgi:hypothetical protein
MAHAAFSPHFRMRCLASIGLAFVFLREFSTAGRFSRDRRFHSQPPHMVLRTRGHRQPPIVWRTSFPLQVQRTLITSDNRSDTISVSDLELAGFLAHKNILVQAVGDIADGRQPCLPFLGHKRLIHVRQCSRLLSATQCSASTAAPLRPFP